MAENSKPPEASEVIISGRDYNFRSFRWLRNL